MIKSKTLFLCILFCIFPLLKGEAIGYLSLSNSSEIHLLSNLEPSTLKVWSITFKGNNTFNSILLDEVIALEAIPYFDQLFYRNFDGYDYEETEVIKDKIRLERFYKRRGFIDIKITLNVTEGEKWWQRNIEFLISEGQPIKIASVHLNLITPIDSSKITQSRNFKNAFNKQPLRAGKRYESIREKEVQGIFEQQFKNIGFPFAQVQVATKIDTFNYRAFLEININTFQLARIDSIRIDGKTTVSKQYILDEGELKEGQIYNQNKISNAQQEIFNHSLFRFITITIPEQKNDSTVNLVMRVQENPLRFLTIRGGVGTEEIVRGEITWGHLNPFGNAHSITVKSRASMNVDAEIRQARIGLDYNIPYLFNTKSGTQTSPFAEYKNEYSYRLNSLGINNSFIYQHSIEWQSSVSHIYTFNRVGEKNSRTISQDSLELYNISSLQFSGFYRQGFISRELGWFINPIIEISGLFGTGTYRYDKFFVDIRRYFDLTKTSQFAFKTHIGFINVKNSDILPAPIRLYAGGRSSVRGWLLEDLGPKRVRYNDDGSFDRYVPTGGKALLALSAEFRQKINYPFNGLGVALFLDGGQVWKSATDIQLLESLNPTARIEPGTSYNGLQYGLGGGLMYDTPIGPIRIDIAYKLNPTEADLGIFQGINYGGSIRRWGIHFSIGHPF